MREISVRVSDDLDYKRDGTRNDATVTLTVGLNGTWAELDLTEGNEKLVRDTLGELMAAGHEPAEKPASPVEKNLTEAAAFNKRLRAWCRETGQRNSSGSGWAYQTNTSGMDYIGEPLARKYQEYLDNKGKR
jgi:hypothetical protein